MPGYRHRPQQAELAGEIASCIETGNVLLAEAETGTGKTLAYLIPALYADVKLLISTHTKALQDQLMYRDLPMVKTALGVSRDVALLKGRVNYVCPHRLEQKLADHRLSMDVHGRIASVRHWADHSPDGDLSGLDFDVFEAGVGYMVTATAEQCLGRNCPEWNDCPLMQARARAMDADIVVANHSLLLADAALKSGEFGEVLPEFESYVLDEAHSLPECASRHFGLQLTRQRFIQWANDAQTALDALGDEQARKQDVTALLRQVLHSYATGSLEQTRQHWQGMLALAGEIAERSEDMARLSDRASIIADNMRSICEPEKGFVAWTEGTGEEIRHMLAPVETGPVLAAHVWNRPAAFVMLSATLRVSGSFAYAKRRLGLDDVREHFHPSPFDYPGQALIYAPDHLPDPTGPDGREMLLAEIEALVRASNGRAFVLFTSHNMLKRIASELATRLPWPVLEQGISGSRDAILERFRADTHSVLCGTRSFWEGVDVPGEALSMVIIDKLPFAPPDDPLLAARIKKCEEQGGNGFVDIQLPEAIAVLRQGMGRLIRSQDDRGVMALLDSRIYRRGYGREVLANLPPAPVSRDIEDVRAFFDGS